MSYYTQYASSHRMKDFSHLVYLEVMHVMYFVAFVCNLQVITHDTDKWDITTWHKGTTRKIETKVHMNKSSTLWKCYKKSYEVLNNSHIENVHI